MTLKRIILTCTCAIMALAVMAGDSIKVSRNDVYINNVPFYDGAHAKDLIEINLHASVGLSSLQLNYGRIVEGLTDFLLSPGLQIKGGVDVAFRLRNSFALATGLDFGINNSRYAMSMVDNRTGSISSLYARNHFYDLTIPIYLSWRLNLGTQAQWLIDGGVYFAFGTGGKLKISGYNSGENALGQPIVTHASFETDYFNSSTPLVNGVKNFDYGPRLATGLLYRQKIMIKFVAQISARNLAINHNVLDARYRNVSFACQIGYSF